MAFEPDALVDVVVVVVFVAAADVVVDDCNKNGGKEHGILTLRDIAVDDSTNANDRSTLTFCRRSACSVARSASNRAALVKIKTMTRPTKNPQRSNEQTSSNKRSGSPVTPQCRLRKIEQPIALVERQRDRHFAVGRCSNVDAITHVRLSLVRITITRLTYSRRRHRLSHSRSLSSSSSSFL